MKTKSYLAIIFMIFACCFMECTERDRAKTDRPNGWYYFTEHTKDSLSSEPIVSVEEFESLRVDEIQIAGIIQPQSSQKWAEATEKSIGKKIGFLYNNKVICAPRINSRIEGGNFTISLLPALSDQFDIVEIYEDLRKEMKDSKE